MKTRTLAAAALALGLSACSAEFSPVTIFAICAPPRPRRRERVLPLPGTVRRVLRGHAGARRDDRPGRLPDAGADRQRARRQLERRGRPHQHQRRLHPVLRDDLLRRDARAVERPGGHHRADGRLVGRGPSPHPGGLLPGTSAAGSAATTTIVVNVRAHGVLASQDSFTTAWFTGPRRGLRRLPRLPRLRLHGSRGPGHLPAGRRRPGWRPARPRRLACATLQ